MSDSNREPLVCQCLDPQHSSPPSKKQDDTPSESALFKLPPELRLLIWALVVRAPDTISITHFAPHLGHLSTIVALCDTPPLPSRQNQTTAFEFTQLSRQINDEAAALYYTSNTFRYVVADRGYVRLRAWIDVVARVVGPRTRASDNNNANGPYLEIEHVGWVHSYNHVPVHHIHTGLAFVGLCRALARAGFSKETVKMTIAGYGSRMAPRRGRPFAVMVALVTVAQKELERILVEEQGVMEVEEKEKGVREGDEKRQGKGHEEAKFES